MLLFFQGVTSKVATVGGNNADETHRAGQLRKINVQSVRLLEVLDNLLAAFACGNWQTTADLARRHAEMVVEAMAAFAGMDAEWPAPHVHSYLAPPLHALALSCTRCRDARTQDEWREAIDAVIPASEWWLRESSHILARAPAPAPQAGDDSAADVAHSPDFRSVRWFGEEYVFTTMQAACIKVLWECWEKRTPVISELTILESAGAASSRLRDVFNKGTHPAWGTMIVSSGKGAYRLSEPT